MPHSTGTRAAAVVNSWPRRDLTEWMSLLTPEIEILREETNRMSRITRVRYRDRTFDVFAGAALDDARHEHGAWFEVSEVVIDPAGVIVTQHNWGGDGRIYADPVAARDAAMRVITTTVDEGRSGAQ